MFVNRPTYNVYRVIWDRTPQQTAISGEDVYALQTALNANGGASLVLDGVCGPKTGAAIWKAQKALGLVEDGKAGVVTQRALALAALQNRATGDLYKLGMGQIEHESSFLLGNYSPPHPDGFWDAGVVQMNTAHYPIKAAFTVPGAIASYTTITKVAYDSYSDTSKFIGEDHSDLRRLALAGGHWNAPAYANWLAGTTPAAKPSDGARAVLEAYMADITTYLYP